MKQKWFRKALEMRGETIEDFGFCVCLESFCVNWFEEFGCRRRDRRAYICVWRSDY